LNGYYILVLSALFKLPEAARPCTIYLLNGIYDKAILQQMRIFLSLN